MVGGMGVWDIAAILFIVFTPLALVVADYGSMILAAVRRQRGMRLLAAPPPGSQPLTPGSSIVSMVAVGERPGDTFNRTVGPGNPSTARASGGGPRSGGLALRGAKRSRVGVAKPVSIWHCARLGTRNVSRTPGVSHRGEIPRQTPRLNLAGGARYRPTSRPLPWSWPSGISQMAAGNCSGTSSRTRAKAWAKLSTTIPSSLPWPVKLTVKDTPPGYSSPDSLPPHPRRTRLVNQKISAWRCSNHSA
jgi:hypothetical protein